MNNRDLAIAFRGRCLDAGLSTDALNQICRIHEDDQARLELAIRRAAHPLSQHEDWEAIGMMGRQGWIDE